jgi:hypothetical protein
MKNFDLGDDLNLKETIVLRKGTCPDCGEQVTEQESQVPNCKKMLCKGCEMQFYLPSTNGIPGERLGKK